MITPEHEYYIRFILLLLQAGTDLLREILEKALQQKGETLGQFLTTAKPALLSDKHLSLVQKDTLCPSHPQVASIADFDITLLSHLLIEYLIVYIDNRETNAVNDIRDVRNNYHAHANEAKMDIVTFTREWNQLATIIKYIGSALSPEVQKRHRDMIASIEKDQLDITTVVGEIQKLDQSRVFFENIQRCLDGINRTQEQLIETVDNVHKDLLDTKAEVMQMKAVLLQIKEQRENHGRITKIVQTVYGTVYLSADDQETIDQAESALLEASNNSIAMKEPTNLSHQDLKEKVALVVGDINNLDVKEEGVKKGSIIFVFKCLSLTAIVRLIDYFYSSNFHRRLDDIAHALENIVGKKICIKAELDRHSVQDVITKMEKHTRRVVQFELSCTGVDGLLHALDIFEEGKLAYSLDRLSKSLSKAVRKPVILHTSIDLNTMRNAIKAIQDQLDFRPPEPCTKENKSTEDPKIDILYLPDQADTSIYDIKSVYAVLSPERLLVADKELKVVDIQTGFVVKKVILEARPSDIALMSKDQVVVTLPLKDAIQIFRTNDLNKIRSIPVEKCPTGITCYQDELYVVCKRFDNIPSVNVLSLQGELKRKVVLEELSISFPKIAVSMNLQSLYITDYTDTSLIRFSFRGKVTARYKFTYWGDTPKTLTILDDGSLLVFSRNYAHIHHISADLEQGYELESGDLIAPIIGYDPDKKRVYKRISGDTNVTNIRKQSSQSHPIKKLPSRKSDEKVSNFKKNSIICQLI